MNPTAPVSRTFSFVAGSEGPWRIVTIAPVSGASLEAATHLSVVAGALSTPPDGARWTLRGITSNERYVTRQEKDRLIARQPALGRPEATHAALIPIRKNAAWWSLTQDERRAIFESTSQHIAIGLNYLPAIARRLHHCRDLGEHEPFDFLTWFEYAAGDEAAFSELLAELRATEEWRYVEREVDVRVVRNSEF